MLVVALLALLWSLLLCSSLLQLVLFHIASFSALSSSSRWNCSQFLLASVSISSSEPISSLSLAGVLPASLLVVLAFMLALSEFELTTFVSVFVLGVFVLVFVLLLVGVVVELAVAVVLKLALFVIFVVAGAGVTAGVILVVPVTTVFQAYRTG